MRRVEKDGDVWIARDKAGREYPEHGFRWNTRAAARCAVWDADNFGRTSGEGERE